MSSPSHDASATNPPLRRGWTTGACATAATKAAFVGLVTGTVPGAIQITLPKGKTPTFTIDCHRAGQDPGGAAWVRVQVIKDAGDDPDVTHLAPIVATVRWSEPGAGVVFSAGVGVGTVTKAGLPLPVGEPAINPGPRAQMRTAIAEVAAEFGCAEDVAVELSVPTGEKLAPRTWNPRLGILGGISILGTTGVVIPYSCSAWMDSIHRGIDVALAAGLTHVVGAVGNTSEKAAMAHLGLPVEAYLDMGDFVGAVLTYLRKHPVPTVTIAGGFAKLTKLADGHLDLHSGRSQVNLPQLATWAESLGAEPDVVAAIKAANTALEVLNLCTAAGVDIAELIAQRAREVAQHRLGEVPVTVRVLVTNRTGEILAEA